MKQQTFQVSGRIIEELLGMSPKTIGAPLWVSGDSKNCPNCDLMAHLTTVRTALNFQRQNAGFSLFNGTNANGRMRVSASVPKTVRSIDLIEHLKNRTRTWNGKGVNICT